MNLHSTLKQANDETERIFPAYYAHSNKVLNLPAPFFQGESPFLSKRHSSLPLRHPHKIHIKSKR